MKHIPLKADSFSSLSRMFRKDRHHGLMKSERNGETSALQLNPKRPRVIAKQIFEKIDKICSSKSHQYFPAKFWDPSPGSSLVLAEEE
jgi:hypothetical protein